MDYTKLNTEINNHPEFVGKTSLEVTAMLNEIGKYGDTAERGLVETHAVMGAALAIIRPHLATIQASNPQDILCLQVIASSPQINLNDADINAFFDSLFAENSPERAALTALTVRPASKAEFLYGTGTVLKPEHIERAIGRTVV
jgi:hypothetical protein